MDAKAKSEVQLTVRPVDGVDVPVARNILAYNMKRWVKGTASGCSRTEF